MELQWLDWHNSELTVPRLYQILSLRNAVFIVEQNCPYQDLDGADLQADNRHITGLIDDELVAYARILTPENESSPVAIGRVIVSEKVRGQRLGEQLMVKAIESCEHHWPQQTISLSAQSHLQAFYAGFGFVAQGESYLEDNIPHIDMLRS